MNLRSINIERLSPLEYTNALDNILVFGMDPNDVLLERVVSFLFASQSSGLRKWQINKYRQALLATSAALLKQVALSPEEDDGEETPRNCNYGEGAAWLLCFFGNLALGSYFCSPALPAIAGEFSNLVYPTLGCTGSCCLQAAQATYTRSRQEEEALRQENQCFKLEKAIEERIKRLEVNAEFNQKLNNVWTALIRLDILEQNLHELEKNGGVKK